MSDRATFLTMMETVEKLNAAGDKAGARAAMLKTPFKSQPGWHFVLARLCIDLNDIEAAVHHGVKAVALSPNNPHYRAMLASALYLASEQEPVALDVAEMEAEKALEIDPSTPSADNTLGLVRLAQGRREEARECFERALQKSPDDSSAQKNLELCLAA